MKSFKLSFIIFISCIALGIFNEYHAGKTTSELISHIEKVEQKYDNNVKQETALEWGEFEKEWNEKQNIFSFVMQGSDFNQVHFNIVKIRNYLYYDDAVMFKSELSGLKEYIKYCHGKKKLSLKNLF